MKSISEAAMSRVESLLRTGHSIRDIAQISGVSRSTISRIRQKILCQSNVIKMGRPRILSTRLERNIARMVSSGLWKNAEMARSRLISEFKLEISSESLRRSLRRSGLQARICPKKPLLRKKHRQARLAFARQYKDWTVEDWKKVVLYGPMNQSLMCLDQTVRNIVGKYPVNLLDLTISSRW